MHKLLNKKQKMDKRHLHHLWKKLKPINPWYFLVIALLFSVISIYALRQNNLQMITLRDAVYAADEKDGDVEQALRDLREYVYSHMNTDLTSGGNSIYPPIQLKYRYERLVEAEKSKTGNDSQVYTDAQSYCEQQIPTGLSGGNRIACIEDYVSTHGAGEAKQIDEALYKFDFVSPRWSPDLAGWSLVAAVLFGVLFIVRLTSELLIRRQLRD